MKVVYFGSDVFISCFEYFVQKHEVLALYTYHNDEDYFTEFEIINRARELGIPVHYESITEEDILRFFREEECGLLFSAEYDRLLKLPENLPEFRGINAHSSLLPQGRSYYPIEAAMERGLARSGVTMHKLAPRLDQGDIIAQRAVDILPGMDSIDVYLYCAAYAREMLKDIMSDLEGCWSRAKAQGEKQQYWHRPADELLTLRHDMRREEALDMFRRYNSTTQVSVNGEWFYVNGIAAGVGPLCEEARFLAQNRLLYRLKDGHLRLQVQKKEDRI